MFAISKTTRRSLQTALALCASMSSLYFSLPIQAQSTAQSWGYNNNGQLGNGFFPSGRTLPGPITALNGSSTGLYQMSGGLAHSVARDTALNLWSWGSNAYGQVGNGVTSTAYTPVSVLTNVTSVSCGAYHTLAVRGDGSVWAWGMNSTGQIGDGTLTNRNTPVPVPGLTNVRYVAAGSAHSLALTWDGKVYAWGHNNGGQLGNGTTTNLLTPTLLTTLPPIQEIAAGAYFCLAAATDGKLYAWGSNLYGQIGDGSGVDQRVPIQVTALSGEYIVYLAAGANHSLARTAAGKVYAWGRNQYGQLGDGTVLSRPAPTLVLSSGVVQVAAGIYHSLAFRDNGGGSYELLAWGYNSYGQIGDGTTSHRSTPTSISTTGNAFFALGSGWYHSLYSHLTAVAY